jgi:hypothetical protein
MLDAERAGLRLGRAPKARRRWKIDFGNEAFVAGGDAAIQTNARGRLLFFGGVFCDRYGT